MAEATAGRPLAGGGGSLAATSHGMLGGAGRALPGALGGGPATAQPGPCGLPPGNRVHVRCLETSCSGSPRTLTGSPRLILGPPRHRLGAETPRYFMRLTFLRCAVRPALLPRAPRRQPGSPPHPLRPGFLWSACPRLVPLPSPMGPAEPVPAGLRLGRPASRPVGTAAPLPGAAAPLQVSGERHAVGRRPPRQGGREAGPGPPRTASRGGGRLSQQSPQGEQQTRSPPKPPQPPRSQQDRKVTSKVAGEERAHGGRGGQAEVVQRTQRHQT